MNRGYLLLLSIALAILFSNCSTHRDLVYLKNKFQNAQSDSVIDEYYYSDLSLIEQPSQLFVFNIFLFAGENCNVLPLESMIIDTSLFCDSYFKKKQFIYDFIEKDKNYSNTLIQVENSYVYNALFNHTQVFIHDNRGQCHLYDCFPQRFYDLIGSLIYNNTLDYVFAYPTHVHYNERIIGTSLGLYFGIKGRKVYVIIDNWTEDNEGNCPQIIPIEEYLDCCWEEMTNVSKN